MFLLRGQTPGLPEGAWKLAGGEARLGEREPPDRSHDTFPIRVACRRYARSPQTPSIHKKSAHSSRIQQSAKRISARASSRHSVCRTSKLQRWQRLNPFSAPSASPPLCGKIEGPFGAQTTHSHSLAYPFPCKKSASPHHPNHTKNDTIIRHSSFNVAKLRF